IGQISSHISTSPASPSGLNIAAQVSVPSSTYFPPMPCAAISKFMIADELPYWSMPPPWITCLEHPRERAREAGEGRLEERPGDPGRALGVAQVGDRALGEVGPDRQVGAVVDLVVADQGLGELDPDRPLHPRWRAVHRV